jgi:hypothetical protein
MLILIIELPYPGRKRVECVERCRGSFGVLFVRCTAHNIERIIFKKD